MMSNPLCAPSSTHLPALAGPDIAFGQNKILVAPCLAMLAQPATSATTAACVTPDATTYNLV